MNKKKKKEANSFKKAVENTPDIANCYQSGLQGLGKHSSKIELTETTKCSGSVDIDACTTAKYPQSNRWDYALCYKLEVFFVEVHTANTTEVSTVLKKLQWLKDWLNQEAPEINKLKAKEQPYVWVQSKGFQIRDSKVRQIVAAGIRPIPKLVLK
jgi:tetrahydrodipicolinate N-succinyltransferase